MQRYCKSREIQKKRKFIFISEMQRIFMVPTLKILQIERNTKETKVYFYFRDAAYLHGANLKDTANREKYKRNESLFLFPRCSVSPRCQP